MKREKLIFIINPVSGSQGKASLPPLIHKHIDKSKFDYQIIFTDYKGQGTEITNLAVANQTSIVVAVGGDGTVNEIAKVLVDTNVALSIIPVGSGNGLARHLHISRDIVKAIQIINKGKRIKIDAGMINKHFFFCTAGVGFDAHIGSVFATKLHRGFYGYLTATIKEFFDYKPEQYHLIIGDKQQKREAFLITFANASQYGNNAFIAPNADIQDNLLDICIMKKFPFISALGLGIRLFTKRIHFSPYVEFLKTNEIKVFRKEAGVVHVDGEPLLMDAQLQVKILPSALNVIIPQ